MKSKYQTKASKAEEEVLSMLKDQKNIHKPWSLVDCCLENRTLQTTASEAAILFYQPNSLRPGYEIQGKTVYVPNLFVKLCGTDTAFSTFQNKEQLEKRGNFYLLPSFDVFPASSVMDPSLESFIKDGLLDKEAILSSSAFRYSFMRREYQEVFVDKVNDILKNKEQYLVGHYHLNAIQIISCLLQVDERFMQAFHHYDYQYTPPAVLVQNQGKEKPTLEQALTLLLLSLLGFDVIILSSHGHADIENYLSGDVYSLFYGESEEGLRPERKKKKLPYEWIAVIAILVILVTGLLFKLADGGSLASFFRIPSGRVALISSSPVPAPGAENMKTSEPTQKPSAAPIQPSQITGQVLMINDPALEQGVRNILGKKEGDITVDEINRIGGMRFIGPYSGGPNWSFLNGYSPDAYHDVNNGIHREEGDIQDLSSLASKSSLNMLEVSWQKSIQIETLKGYTGSDLRLLHDNLTDISVLGAMKNLMLLDLGYNFVSDLSPIASLRIHTLRLQFNNVSDVRPLAKMKDLRFLDLCGNPVEDMSPLAELTGLTNLYILNAPINDFAFLKNLTQLESLNIEGTGLADASILKDHTRLSFLCLADNPIDDLSQLRNLKRLRHLDISMTNVQDLSVLKELPSLRTVNMSGVVLEDETILKELQNVEFRR